MDNIWADSFSEIREHSLQEKKQDKKEGKPKRWWDDDGDGIGYEKGEVSGSFKKTKKEGKDYDPMEDPEFDHDEAERTRGQSGKNKSIGGKKKTKKEEVEIEEGLKQARKNVGASTCWDGYKAKGTKKKNGKEVPNCVPEETEVAEEKKPLPKNRMFRKMGNLGRDIVSKNTSDDDRQKKYDRQKKITKVFNANEERELSSKKDNGEMIDVMKGKNKIEINPKLGEEIEAWVGQLLDEGYDLSQFTPDEIVEIYESAEGEDNTQVSAVKAAAARSRVRADRDRLRVSQMQQRTKTAPMESVLNFVEGRTLPNFEV